MILPVDKTIKELTEIFGKHIVLKKMDLSKWLPMQYPKLIPFMKLKPIQYEAEGFGNLMSLETKAMGGIMKLATVVFTPSSGIDVPLLLIDIMAMGSTRTVFVEYYGLCEDTPEKEKIKEGLMKLKARYDHLKDYDEKDHWYVKERAPYSLIKSEKSTPESEEVFSEMLREEVEMYASICEKAIRQETGKKENLQNLLRFQDDMVNKGNPSKKALEMILKEKGAETFFREVIMPVKYPVE